MLYKSINRRCLRKDGLLEACSETDLLAATRRFYGSSTLEASCRRAACSFMPQSVHWNSLPLTDLLGGNCVTPAGSSSTTTRYGGYLPPTRRALRAARAGTSHAGSDRRISTGNGRKAAPRASRFTSPAAPRARRSTASRETWRVALAGGGDDATAEAELLIQSHLTSAAAA